jgi:hypothetical protein
MIFQNNLKIGAPYMITFPHTNFSSVYTLLRSHNPVARHEPLHTFLDKYGNKVTFTSGVFQQMSVVEWTVHESRSSPTLADDAYVSISMPDWSSTASAASASASASSAYACPNLPPVPSLTRRTSNAWPDLPPVPSHVRRQSNAWPDLPPVPPELRLPMQQINFKSVVPQPVSLADYLKEKPTHKLAEMSDDELYG